MKKTTKRVITALTVLSLAEYTIAFLNARGLSKHNDKELLGQASDVMTGFSYTADNTVIIDDTEVKVTFNPYVHMMTNMVGSVAIVLSTGHVFTDNTFNKLSKKGQSFVLHHEVGHTKLGHKGGLAYPIKRVYAILTNNVLDIEVAADKWAMERIGKDAAIEGLVELKSYVMSPIGKREIILRIKELNK